MTTDQTTASQGRDQFAIPILAALLGGRVRHRPARDRLPDERACRRLDGRRAPLVRTARDPDATPRWLIPALGGAVFLSLIGLWLTSALWLFTTKGVHS